MTARTSRRLRAPALAAAFACLALGGCASTPPPAVHDGLRGNMYTANEFAHDLGPLLRELAPRLRLGTVDTLPVDLRYEIAALFEEHADKLTANAIRASALYRWSVAAGGEDAGPPGREE